MAETNPFDGPGWDEWNVTTDFAAENSGWLIYGSGELSRKWRRSVAKLPTPQIARQIVELIEAAERGEPVPTLADVSELVDSLERLANSGYNDFGGSYVLLQVDESDVVNARVLLAKYAMPIPNPPTEVQL